MRERSLRTVPRTFLLLLAAALVVQVAVQLARPRPAAHAEALSASLPVNVVRAASGGDEITTAQGLALYLQAFDNQPGISIPFMQLDYARVMDWLGSILALDPEGQYPLMMASQLYAQVPDEGRQRQMIDFVHRQFLADPDRRWRWLAHCALVARHRLRDLPLALRYADEITRHARDASGWARQMGIFMRADLGERERARVLLGGLLASGEVTDPKEIHFLTERLEELKSAENSTRPSKN